MRVCIIGSDPREKGGVAKSTLYMIYVYKMLGHHIVWINPKNISLSRLSKCDVVHSHVPLMNILNILKLILSKKPRKILTLHGWVLDEAKVLVFTSHGTLERVKRSIFYIVVAVSWIMHRFILVPFIYDYVTAVSYITARKNGVRALITPNPTKCVDDNLTVSHSNTVHASNEIVFVTYVSVGGGKILSIPRLIKIIYLLNKKLEALGFNKHVVLHIYGKDLPSNFIKRISKYQYVKFMGYVPDYLERLKKADLFLAGYTFPELGHAVLEAICAGVPIAKFTEDTKLEEIIDGFNGILASNDEEMIEKLVKYVLNIDDMKRRLAVNAKNTIVEKRKFKYIATMWKIIIQGLFTQRNRNNRNQ